VTQSYEFRFLHAVEVLEQLHEAGASLIVLRHGHLQFAQRVETDALLESTADLSVLKGCEGGVGSVTKNDTKNGDLSEQLALRLLLWEGPWTS